MPKQFGMPKQLFGTNNIEVSSKQVNLLVVPRVIIQNSCLFSRTSILLREREGAERAQKY